MRVYLFLLMVALMSGTVARALAKAATPEREIEGHIRNLVHDEARVRDAAAAALVKIGPEVVEPLTKAMGQMDSPELRGRARQILLLCKRGGAVVDGLQLTLTASGTGVGAGEDVMLTTVIRNTSAEDINLCVGVSYSGVVFEEGSALVVSDAHENPLKSHWMVGFCGTGAYSLNVTVPANGAVTYASPLKVQPWPDRVQRGGRTERILSPGRGYRMVELPDGAEAIRVKMKYSSSGAGRGFGGEGLGLGKPANREARYWSGTIESNELQLAVLRAAE